VGDVLGALAEVPLAYHVRVVATVAQQRRHRHHPIVQMAFVAWLAELVVGLDLEHVAEAGEVVVDAGHQHGAGRRAGGPDVEVREVHSRVGEPVQVRGLDLAAEGADVTESQVVGQQDEDIRTSRRSCLRAVARGFRRRPAADHSAHEGQADGGSREREPHCKQSSFHVVRPLLFSRGAIQ
jgi:hypothetical protein